MTAGSTCASGATHAFHVVRIWSVPIIIGEFLNYIYIHTYVSETSADITEPYEQHIHHVCRGQSRTCGKQGVRQIMRVAEINATISAM